MTNEEFIEELSDKYYTKLYIYVSCNCSDKDIVEDIIQETLFIAYKKADEIRTYSNILAWLYQTAHFCILRSIKNILYLEDIQEVSENIENENHFEEDSIRALDFYPEVAKRISREEFQLIFKHYEEGYGFAELAEEKNTSVDAIRMKISRIKSKLRKINIDCILGMFL